MRKTPQTLGVLSMIFGSLIAVWSVITLGLSSFSSAMMGNFAAMGNLPRRPGQPDPQQLMANMKTMMAQIAPYTYSLILGRLLLSIALIIIGYALYKRQSRGRSAAIVWSVLALVFVGIEIAINVGIIQPRTMAMVQQMLADMPNGQAGNAMVGAMKGVQGAMTVIFSLVFYAPYPVVLLALCGRRSAAADFTD